MIAAEGEGLAALDDDDDAEGTDEGPAFGAVANNASSPSLWICDRKLSISDVRNSTDCTSSSMETIDDEVEDFDGNCWDAYC